MKRWTVYEHISPSGKVYVGITCQEPTRRWKGGAGYVRKDGHQKKFANAILKYGWDNFEHKVIATDLTKEEADNIEVALISKYKRQHISYNITDGGDGGLGTKHTEETKRIISELHKGRKIPKSVCEKREKAKIKNRKYYILAVKPGVILQFDSNKEAAEALGIKSRTNISSSITQKQCLVNGYVFMHWSKDVPIKEDSIYECYYYRVNNRYSSERRK